MNMCTSLILKMTLFTFLLICILQTCSAVEPLMFKRVRGCLSKPLAVICLKEEALQALNRTIMSEKPMRIFDFIDIEKNANYKTSLMENELPEEVTERDRKLNNLLYRKVEEFFESRTLKFNLANVVEGRKKKDKTGSYMMMGGLAMAGMLSQMFMGKIAFLAGAALLVAKIALMLAAIGSLKKSGGGGSSEHVVYTNADTGYGHSHGGWHRSLTNPEAQNVVYAGQLPMENNYTY